MSRLVINTHNKKSKISKEIYVHFSEHLGRCINEEIKKDEESVNLEKPDNDSNGSDDSGKKPIENNSNTLKLPQTGAMDTLFTLVLGGTSVSIGGINLKKKIIYK